MPFIPKPRLAASSENCESFLSKIFPPSTTIYKNVHLFGAILLSESSKALHITSLCDPSIIHYSASRQSCQNLVRVIKTSSTRKPAATDAHSQPDFQDWWSKPRKMFKYFHHTIFWKCTSLTIFTDHALHFGGEQCCHEFTSGKEKYVKIFVVKSSPQLILLVTGGDGPGPHWDEKCSRIRDQFWEVDVTSAFHRETGPAQNQTRSRLALKSIGEGIRVCLQMGWEGDSIYWTSEYLIKESSFLTFPPYAANSCKNVVWYLVVTTVISMK